MAKGRTRSSSSKTGVAACVLIMASAVMSLPAMAASNTVALFNDLN
jgi:hypothetical protein